MSVLFALGILNAYTKVLPGGQWLGEYAPIKIYTPTFGTSTIHESTEEYNYDEDDELECWETGQQVQVRFLTEKGIYVVEPFSKQRFDLY